MHWSLSEVQLSFEEIMDKGGDLLPCWEDIRKGSTPPQSDDGFDASEWKKGWQYYTCSIFETCFMNNVIRPSCSSSRLALFSRKLVVLGRLGYVSSRQGHVLQCHLYDQNVSNSEALRTCGQRTDDN